MSELNSENIYFTNDVDDLDFIKNSLSENSIPHEIIFNNNSHPIFGTTVSMGMDNILYKYVIRVPVEYIDKAQSLLKEVLNSDEEVGQEELPSVTDSKESLASNETGQKSVTKKSFARLLVILLLVFIASLIFVNNL